MKKKALALALATLMGTSAILNGVPVTVFAQDNADTIVDDSVQNEVQENLPENSENTDTLEQEQESTVDDAETGKVEEVPENVEESDVAAQEKENTVDNAETKDTGVYVDINVPETFQTYIDPVTHVEPTELTVSVPVSISQPGLEDVTIEIPYGFIPDPDNEVYKYFTMYDPIFNFVKPNAPEENSIVDYYDNKDDKLIIHLKKTTQTVETLNLKFRFNEKYNGNIPAEQIIWNNLQATVKTSDGNIIDQSEIKQVRSDAKDGMETSLSRFNPINDELFENNIVIRFRWNNNYRQYSYLEESDNNKIYIEAPTGSTLANELKQYFNLEVVTSEEDPSIPNGYSRYYGKLTDSQETFRTWEYGGNPNDCHTQIEASVTLPDTIDEDQKIKVTLGMIYKKVNDKEKEVSFTLEYTKKERPDWGFVSSDVHDNGANYKTIVVQGIEEESVPKRSVNVGGYYNYSHQRSMKNIGKNPIKKTKIVLQQPNEGSGKVNFKDIEVNSYTESQSIPAGYLKVELEIKNALTGATKIVNGGFAQGKVKVALPELSDNEYINKVIVTPMGIDGKSEGDFASRNSIILTYMPVNWKTDHWPDGTEIPLNKKTSVEMSWSMEYLDETEGKEQSLKTLQGRTYSIFYVPEHTTDARAAFVSSDAQGGKPGEEVNYEIVGYNEINAVGSWENPEIGVAIPKVLRLQEPATLKSFIDEKNSKIYENAVKVTLVSSDENYNYYRFNVTGTAYKNDAQPSFSIPLKFKVQDGTSPGTYAIPYATVANNTPNFVQLNQLTNNLDSDVAKAFGYDNSKENSYSGFTDGHTALTVVYASKLSGSTAGRENSDDEWSNVTDFAVEKGGKPQMKATISNVGNTTFENVRLYDILPSAEDGRGSTGNISFTGLDDISEATIYYTMKPVSDLPKYTEDLQDWDDKKLEDLGFTTNLPENLSDVTAIYIDFGDKKISPTETLDVVLNFLVPEEDDQSAVNLFRYSAKEADSGTILNANSDEITFTTKIAQILFEENLPDFLAQGINSADNMPESQNVKLETDGTGKITISEKRPTLVAYDFVHWKDEKENTYDPGDTMYFSPETGNMVTLKAVWEPKKVDVIYNENFGDNAKETTKEYSFGGTVDSSDVSVSARTGYTFKGWSESKIATSADFLDGHRIDFLDTKTVYAVWQANTYTIHFDANGGTGEMLDQVMTYDVERALNKNEFTKEGYTFKGWNVKEKGIWAIPKFMIKSVTYTDGQKVKNLTDQAGGEITLVAVWEANDYTIHFDANGGTGEMSDQAMTYDVEQALNRNEFTKEGYTFKGWATEPNGEVVYADEAKVKNLISKADGSVTLYAVWSINSYDVTFNSQGGSHVDNQSVKYNELVEQPEDPRREGYTFGGWYKEEECNTIWNFNTDKMPASNLTLHAKWILNASELNHMPTINATDKVLTVGDEFDPLDGVTAHDEEDGDVTDKIEVIENAVDTSKAGTYSITYKVTDSQGASSLKTITVVVNPKLEVINHMPTIDAMDKVLTVGDEFDPLDGVTAHDEEDGDLTDKIEVIENAVDTSKAGAYAVTYKVTDKDGASTTKTIYVAVNPRTEVIDEAPIINAEDKTLTVGDTFDPMKDVTATDAEDGDLTDKIVIAKNTVDTSKVGKYMVVYEVSDSHGTRVVRTIYVTVQQKAVDTGEEDGKEEPNVDSSKDTAQTSTQTNVLTWTALGVISLGVILTAILRRKH